MSIGRTLILRNVPCSITTFSAPAGGSIFAPPADLKAEDELRHNAERKSSARHFFVSAVVVHRNTSITAEASG
jgi:hypothetical protein